MISLFLHFSSLDLHFIISQHKSVTQQLQLIISCLRAKETMTLPIQIQKKWRNSTISSPWLTTQWRPEFPLLSKVVVKWVSTSFMAFCHSWPIKVGLLPLGIHLYSNGKLMAKLPWIMISLDQLGTHPCRLLGSNRESRDHSYVQHLMEQCFPFSASHCSLYPWNFWMVSH